MPQRFEKFNPMVGPGERLSLTGRAGSGKTFLGRYFMARSNMRWLVLDTKHDPAFDKSGAISGLARAEKIAKTWASQAIVVVRPTASENKPIVLDAYLYYLHESFDNFGIFIDEAYQVCFGSNPGRGITGLLTRGRVRNQSVIVGSQRPTLIPKFCFSESNYFAIMSLNLEQDRKTMVGYTGDPAVMKKLPPRKFYWYDVSADELTRSGAVTITQREVV